MAHEELSNYPFFKFFNLDPQIDQQNFMTTGSESYLETTDWEKKGFDCLFEEIGRFKIRF